MGLIAATAPAGGYFDMPASSNFYAGPGGSSSQSAFTSSVTNLDVSQNVRNDSNIPDERDDPFHDYLSPNSSNNPQDSLIPSNIPVPPTQISTSPSSSQNFSSAAPTKTTPSSSPFTTRIQKRTLNTLAARRYRQRRVDQISSLETALKETQQERDELKVRVARLEGEVEVLRGLVRKGG